MNIAIDISPLQTGHKVRGTGFYLHYLKESLVKYFPEHSYNFFTDRNSIGDADVVHYPYLDPFQRTLPFQKKYKTVVTVHDLTPIVFPKLFPVGIRGKLNWEIQKQVLKRVDAIITDSECSKKDVIKKVGVPEKSVNAVYLAAGEEFRPMANGKWRMEIIQKYNLPEKFVLYVGDVTPNKNLPRLLEAMKKIDVPLVMVGKALQESEYDRNHPWNEDLVTVQRMATDNPNIHILGFLPTPDVVSLYNMAIVFVMPSLYEGFGLPVLEAMSCGTPVVTTTGGSLSEVAGEAALVVDARSTEELATGIMKLYGDKKLQDKFSREGLKQAEKFSWKKTAEETLKVYESTFS